MDGMENVGRVICNGYSIVVKDINISINQLSPRVTDRGKVV